MNVINEHQAVYAFDLTGAVQSTLKRRRRRKPRKKGK